MRRKRAGTLAETIVLYLTKKTTKEIFGHGDTEEKKSVMAL